VFVVVMYVGGVSSKLPASARSEAIVRCGRAQNVSVWIPIDPVPAAASLAFVRASHASGTWYRRPPPRQPRVCRVLLIVMPSGEGVDVGRGPASVFCTKGGGGGSCVVDGSPAQVPADDGTGAGEDHGTDHSNH
jgi:hypothetical protein